MLNSINIAIVDDDEGELRYIEKTVTHAFQKLNITYTVQTFQSARAMLQHQKTQPFDAVFLDIDMPDVNGMDAAEELDRHLSVGITAFRTETDGRRCRAYQQGYQKGRA